MKTFKHPQDVLNHYDAKDEEWLSHRFYKMTDCGAWAKFGTRTRRLIGKPETWIVLTRRGIDGVYIIKARRPGRAFVFGHGIPEYVRDYFLAEKTGNKTALDIQEWEQFQPNGADILEVVVKDALTRSLTVTLDNIQTVTENGLRVGTIVEGSDAEFDEFLAFPFTLDQLNAAIQGIELAADDAWQEAHERVVSLPTI